MANQQVKLLEELSANLQTKSRKVNRMYGYDGSNAKLAQQRTQNWIGRVLGKIDEPWTKLSLSKDQTRVLLKCHLYPKNFNQRNITLTYHGVFPFYCILFCFYCILNPLYISWV